MAPDASSVLEIFRQRVAHVIVGAVAHFCVGANNVHHSLSHDGSRDLKSANELRRCGIVCTFQHFEPKHVNDHDRPP